MTHTDRKIENRCITLRYVIPFSPPLTRLEIEIRPQAQKVRVQVKAHGISKNELFESEDDDLKKTLLAKADCTISTARFKKAWKTIVQAGGQTLADYTGPGRGTDFPTARVELAWEDGSHHFGGYDLAATEPYKTIVKTIENLAKNPMKEVYDEVYPGE